MSSFFPLYSVKGFSGGLGDFFLGIQKQFYQVGIKIRAGALFDNGKARFQRHCIPVAAFLGYGIEYIRNCHNSGVEGDAFTNQSLWVALPVVFLMMVSGNLVCNLQKIRVFQVMKGDFYDLTALGGVFLHNREFLRRQLPGLLQDAVRGGNFADVMQRGSIAYIGQVVLAGL